MSRLAPAARPLPYDLAFDVAQDLLCQLLPFCQRVAIAGSLRRRREFVNDLELVMVPRVDLGVQVQEAGELFSQPRDLDHLELAIARLKTAGVLMDHPVDPKDGRRYKKLWLCRGSIQADLFIVRPPAQWGPMLAIRTGPANFSRMLVTKLRWQRRRLQDGRVIDFDGREVECTSEEHFFDLCCVPFLPPEQRGVR